MGVRKRLKGLFKSQRRKQQEDLQNRAKQFLEEYKTIRARYQCDFQAYLKFKDQGEGGIAPAIRVIDITKTIETEDKAEEEAERKKEELEKANQEKKNEDTKS